MSVKFDACHAFAIAQGIGITGRNFVVIENSAFYNCTFDTLALYVPVTIAEKLRHIGMPISGAVVDYETARQVRLV